MAGAAAGGAPPTQKTSDIIGNLRPTKLFRFPNSETAVTSLSFDDSGELLLAACSDESLQLYNAREGRPEKTLLSKKYGCHLARFTHHSSAIVYASTKLDDTVRYLSTHDNQYLRYFKGHSAPVTALAVSPGNDTFVSCSLDNSVRLWDLGSPNAQGRLNLAKPTLAAYDPSASVLAVASPAAAQVLLYDLRNFDHAPFSTFDLRELDDRPLVQRYYARQQQQAGKGDALGAGIREWTKLDFSNDGRHVLLATASSAGHILLDAFTGELKAFLVRQQQHLPLDPALTRPAPFPQPPPQGAPATLGQGDACFSSDGRYVIGASGGERDAVVWDLQTVPEMRDEGTMAVRPTASLPCKGRVGVVEWNPRYNMLATADKEVVMWLPDEHIAPKPA